MRALLSCLLCFVFLESQALAVHQSNSSLATVDIFGTYAGVLIPSTITDVSSGTTSPVPTEPSSTSSSSSVSGANSIALFDVGIPTSGLGSGAFLAFVNGRIFSGTIDAIGDPDANTIIGILQASFTTDLTVFTTSTSSSGTSTNSSSVTVTATVSGSMQADVLPPDLGTTALGRLEGTATLDVSFGEFNTDLSPVIAQEIAFTVDGFKQSETAITGGGAAAGGSTTTTTGG